MTSSVIDGSHGRPQNRPLAATFEHLRELGSRRTGTAAGDVILSELGPSDYLVSCRAACVNIVLSGEERYEIAGRTHLVKAGEFLFLSSRARARVIVSGRNPVRALCVYLPTACADAGDRYLGSQESEEREPDRCLVLNAAGSPFGRALRRSARLILEDPLSGPIMAGRIASHVKRQLPAFEGTLKAKLERISATKPSTRAHLLERLERARTFLHDNNESSVSLATLSRVAGVSEFHLSRLFTALYGESPARYHRALRLRKIAAMVAGGSCTLERAAEVYGYSDSASLSRALRREEVRSKAGRPARPEAR